MKLFVGNATSKNFEFHYRLPERTSILHQEILMGQQVQITGRDMTMPEIEAVIKQGSVYGLIAVEEVDRRMTQYRGLCYSVDKPIASTKIEKLFHANTEVLVMLGKELRKNAALVENNRLLRANQDMDLPPLRRTQMSIQEEDGQMAEGFEAVYETGSSRAPRARKRR
jgi:hypothetical protein